MLLPREVIMPKNKTLQQQEERLTLNSFKPHITNYCTNEVFRQNDVLCINTLTSYLESLAKSQMSKDLSEKDYATQLRKELINYLEKPNIRKQVTQYSPLLNLFQQYGFLATVKIEGLNSATRQDRSLEAANQPTTGSSTFSVQREPSAGTSSGKNVPPASSSTNNPLTAAKSSAAGTSKKSRSQPKTTAATGTSRREQQPTAELGVATTVTPAGSEHKTQTDTSSSTNQITEVHQGEAQDAGKSSLSPGNSSITKLLTAGEFAASTAEKSSLRPKTSPTSAAPVQQLATVSIGGGQAESSSTATANSKKRKISFSEQPSEIGYSALQTLNEQLIADVITVLDVLIARLRHEKAHSSSVQIKESKLSALKKLKEDLLAETTTSIKQVIATAQNDAVLNAGLRSRTRFSLNVIKDNIDSKKASGESIYNTKGLFSKKLRLAASLEDQFKRSQDPKVLDNDYRANYIIAAINIMVAKLSYEREHSLRPKFLTHDRKDTKCRFLRDLSNELNKEKPANVSHYYNTKRKYYADIVGYRNALADSARTAKFLDTVNEWAQNDFEGNLFALLAEKKIFTVGDMDRGMKTLQKPAPTYSAKNRLVRA